VHQSGPGRPQDALAADMMRDDWAKRFFVCSNSGFFSEERCFKKTIAYLKSLLAWWALLLALTSQKRALSYN
jgi:hypothetical protein